MHKKSLEYGISKEELIERMAEEYEKNGYWENLKKKHQLPAKPCVSKSIPSVCGDQGDDPLDEENEQEHRMFVTAQKLNEYQTQSVGSLLTTDLDMEQQLNFRDPLFPLQKARRSFKG